MTEPAKTLCSCMCCRSVLSDFLWPHGLQSTRFFGPWTFPGKNTGMGCHVLFQGILLTPGSRQCLLLSQVDSLPLSHPDWLYSKHMGFDSQLNKYSLVICLGQGTVFWTLEALNNLNFQRMYTSTFPLVIKSYSLWGISFFHISVR